MTKILLRYAPLGFALFAASAAGATSTGYGLNGTAGLIDMPTAQVLPDGETAFTFSKNGTSFNSTLTFQLLPRLETAVHFTTIDQWLGGPLYDSSFDFKYRIFDESGNLPSLAIGFRDFLSNGAFSSEYLVASKSIGDTLTVTGGLGWGRLGSYNPVAAPFGPRPPAVSTGIDTNQFFRGNMAFFGGLEWKTPVKGLTLKAEYSSDAYTGEQTYGTFTPVSPFNFGIDYQPVRGVSLGAYYNYGTDFGVRLTFSGNPNRPIVSPDLGIGPVPVNPRPAGYSTDGSWTNSTLARDSIATALVPVFEAEGILIDEMKISPDSIDLYIENTKMPLTSKAIGRIARTLSVAMPASIEYFRITPVSGGLATTTVVIRRTDLEAQVERPDAGPASWQTTQFVDAPNSLGDAAWKRDIYPDFTWSLSPSLPIDLSSASAAASFDVLLGADASYRVSRGFSINGSVSQKLYGSVARSTVPSASPTPVRSNIGLYGAGGGPSLDRLTADYVFKLSPSTYGRVSAGYLERMFAGVNGEVLWKPANSKWALGIEVSAVRQRAYDNMFGLGSYQTVTGFGSVYWDTGFYGLEAQLDVGRYLAGDVGSTLTLSRVFDNGWEVSGFVTLTNMSFADFGPGNFAKGISVKIPLRWTMPFDTRSTPGISLGTLGGDGGARLAIDNRLYPVLRQYDVLDFNETWGAFWQ